MRNQQVRTKGFLSSLSHKHHFSNPNTLEIVFSLLFLSIIYRLLDFLSRDGRY
ncbi:MAG TPA: hypothetical protein VFK97_03185 [Candidatus Saccharimonadales bacterium]|nr:hypothetical protein [Candidatus Saccharimonadales bacterium]